MLLNSSGQPALAVALLYQRNAAVNILMMCWNHCGAASWFVALVCYLGSVPVCVSLISHLFKKELCVATSLQVWPVSLYGADKELS